MNELLTRLGFHSDPFASTNADEEPQLASYFVPPPYFATVRGDPRDPKSHVVLAPRGGGKSAQRRMIERVSSDLNFSCITYDEFEIARGLSLGDVSWEHHVEHICRLMTVAILVALDEEVVTTDSLDADAKRVVKYCAERFLGDLSAAELNSAIRSVKTYGDKAKEFWNKFGGPIAGVINVVLERLKLHAITIDASFGAALTRPDSLGFLVGRLAEVTRSLGYESTYILVDRVDENSLTMMDAASTFAFIRPLLVDLAILEQDGLAFKFFLWDAIRDDYRSGGARPDRIPIYELSWSVGDLMTMMSERLKAFSNNKVSSLNALTCDDVDVDLDKLAAHLATGSPRDLIRLMGRIVAEETRVSMSSECVRADSIWAGVRTFSVERAEELFPDQLQELRRVGAKGNMTFTINYLANDVYRISTQAARQRVQNWQHTGLIDKVDEQPNPPNRPMYVYGPVDLRLAIAMLSNLTPDEVLANFALVCPECGAVAISDRQEVLCTACSHQFRLRDATSLLVECELQDSG